MKNKHKFLVTLFITIAAVALLLPIFIDPIARLVSAR